MKRIIVPAVGLVLVSFTVAQVKATRDAQAAPRTASAAPKRALLSAEGRVVAYPGAEVTIGADVAGTIERIAVVEKDSVRKGEIIAVIRADDTRAAVAEAEARVAEAEADIRLFEAERDRARTLWQEDVGPKQAWEKAERDIAAARARRASVVAELRRLEAVVEKTIIRAPIDGTVIERLVDRGEPVAAGQTLATIADLRRTRIEAEVDEFDAARVAVGRDVFITAEAWEGREWRGTIEEIPDAVTSRRLKPQDPSKPVDTRVLLVKVVPSEPVPLKLGQRVEVKIAQ